MLLSRFSNKLIKSEWFSFQLIIFKVKHTWTNLFACAHLFTFVMKCHDRQSSERCIRKFISRHCLDKTRTGWNDFLFLITDDRDFRPQTCTNGLVFRECKHIKNIFEDVYFTKNSFHITLKMKKIDHLILFYPAISTFAVQICYTNTFLLYSY